MACVEFTQHVGQIRDFEELMVPAGETPWVEQYGKPPRQVDVVLYLGCNILRGEEGLRRPRGTAAQSAQLAYNRAVKENISPVLSTSMSAPGTTVLVTDRAVTKISQPKTRSKVLRFLT